jgi:hypothetical protein
METSQARRPHTLWRGLRAIVSIPERDDQGSIGGAAIGKRAAPGRRADSHDAVTKDCFAAIASRYEYPHRWLSGGARMSSVTGD